jgi:hypothetical protein
VHHREDERFLMIVGAARFAIGDDSLDATAGDLVLLPRGIPHDYTITSETACLVGMVTPGGFESFFTDLGSPLSEKHPQANSRSDDLLKRVASRYGIEIVRTPRRLRSPARS